MRRPPLFAALLAAGAWGALRQRAFGVFLVAVACTGFLTQAARPDIVVWGEWLIVPAWLLPAVGVPLLLHRRARRPADCIPAPRRTEDESLTKPDGGWART